MQTILFVCEHGSAKSVVAAAHFNRLAVQRGLDVRAISRGTDPDTQNHPAAVDGLAADGLETNTQPRLLEQSELDSAARVVTFCELPPTYDTPTNAVLWTVPPISENYAVSLQSILQKLEHLMADVARQP